MLKQQVAIVGDADDVHQLLEKQKVSGKIPRIKLLTTYLPAQRPKRLNCKVDSPSQDTDPLD